MNLTTRGTVWMTLLVAVIVTIIMSLGDETITTWGVYAYCAASTLIVAGVMSVRTTLLRAWTPRVFIFTWWQWVIGGLLLFIAYRISPLAEPPDWVNLAARTIVATATTMLLIILRYRVSRSDPTAMPHLLIGPDKEDAR